MNVFSFYVDEVPIREIVRNEAMGSDYPSKPMSLYSTIWDGSTWATQGGRYHVNYRFQPFTAEFKDLVLLGCPINPSIVSVTASASASTSANCSNSVAALEANPLAAITDEGRKSMRWFRGKYMYYSYCYDSVRYPVPPPECVIVMEEQNLFKETGRLKNIRFVHPRGARRRGSRVRRRENIRRRKESPPPPVVESKDPPPPPPPPPSPPPPPPPPREELPRRRRFPAPPEATATGFL